jgi:hypothetical protein
MKIHCISTELTENQAKKIWAQKPQFLQIRGFSLTIGQAYWVYGLAILSGEPWVYILDTSKYLRPVPLCLFEIIDRRISKYWVVKLHLDGNISMSYPTIVDNPYYLDDLSEYDPEIVKDFQKIQELLYTEFNGVDNL